MEPNSDQEMPETKASSAAAGASSGQAEDSVKSKILERVKDQMSQESVEPGSEGGGVSPIYLKAPDDYP